MIATPTPVPSKPRFSRTHVAPIVAPVRSIVPCTGRSRRTARTPGCRPARRARRSGISATWPRSSPGGGRLPLSERIRRSAALPSVVSMMTRDVPARRMRAGAQRGVELRVAGAARPRRAGDGGRRQQRDEEQGAFEHVRRVPETIRDRTRARVQSRCRTRQPLPRGRILLSESVRLRQADRSVLLGVRDRQNRDRSRRFRNDEYKAVIGTCCCNAPVVRRFSLCHRWRSAFGGRWSLSRPYSTILR